MSTRLNPVCVHKQYGVKDTADKMPLCVDDPDPIQKCYYERFMNGL